MYNILLVFIKTGASFWFCLLSLEKKKKEKKNRTEKPPGSQGWTRLVPAPWYILGRVQGIWLSSTLSKTKHPKNHPQLSLFSLRASPGEGASPCSRAEWGRGWQSWEGHSCLPTDRSFPFPTSQEGMGWGRRGTTHSGGAAPGCASSVAARGIPLARVRHDAAHLGEVPKADTAIHSFIQRIERGIHLLPCLSSLSYTLIHPKIYIHFSFQVALDRTFEKLCQITWGRK